MNQIQHREFNKDFLEYLRGLEPDFLEKARVSGYICPICSSGSGDKGTGIAYNKAKKRATCFACDAGQRSAIDWWAFANHLNPDDPHDFCEAVEGLASYARVDVQYEGGTTNTASPPEIKKQRATKAQSPRRAYDSETDTPELQAARLTVIKAAQRHIEEPIAVAYLKRRGITLAVAKEHMLGYCAKWRGVKDKSNVPTSPRIIIPTSNNSYLARDIRSNEEFNTIPEQYREKAIRATKRKDGPVQFFNIDALKNKKCIPVVTEGEFDALAIEQGRRRRYSVRGFGLGSANRAKDFITLLETMPSEDRPRGVILALDNDDPGIKAAKTIAQGLTKLHIPFVSLNFDGKDPNEALVKDVDKLKTAIGVAVHQVSQKMNQMIPENPDTPMRDNITQIGQDNTGNWNGIGSLPGNLTIAQYESAIRLVAQRATSSLDTTQPAPELEYIANLFPRGYYSLLAAAPGVGKTFLLERIAVDLSLGGKVLNGFGYTDKPLTTLIMSGEAGTGLLIRRAQMLKWKLDSRYIKIFDAKKTAKVLGGINLDKYEGRLILKSLLVLQLLITQSEMTIAIRNSS